MTLFRRCALLVFWTLTTTSSGAASFVVRPAASSGAAVVLNSNKNNNNNNNNKLHRRDSSRLYSATQEPIATSTTEKTNGISVNGKSSSSNDNNNSHDINGSTIADVRGGGGNTKKSTTVVSSIPTLSSIPMENNMVLTPAQTHQLVAAKGEANSKLSVIKIATLSIMGGFYAGVGGMMGLAFAGNLPSADLGLAKFSFAMVFCVALFLVLQTGAQLFTGNTASMVAAYCEKKVTIKDIAKSWFLSFVGNFVGCLMFAGLCEYAGVLTGGARTMVSNMAVAKTSMAFGPTLVRAMLCNWLVCLSIFCCTAAKDVVGKYISIIVPITAFVTIGFEHSVANMFLLPAGLIAKAPGVTWSTIFIKNLIPVTIGNALSGALMVGAAFSWFYGKLGEGK